MEDESERDGGDQRAGDHPHRLAHAGAGGRQPRCPPRAISEHRQCRSGGVRERQQDRAQSDRVVGRDDGDCREHRPRARDEHEPERRAEEEPAADAARAGSARRRRAAARSGAPTRGMSSVAAITNSRTIARFRRKSSGSPSWSRSHAANRVKTVKLATSPATMRSGLRPEAPAASRIGSTGSTHGDTAVTTPARKPMASRISIRLSDPVCR